MTKTTTLSPEQRQRFEADGYLALPGFYSADECRSLRDRMASMLAEFGAGSGTTIFSPTDQSHASEEYFLTSGGAIRAFLEPDAVGDDGALTVAPEEAINKVGHALHDLDPTFDAFSRKPALAGLAAGLGIVQPLLLQSMYIFKQPGIGAEVSWHTDHTFLWTEPQSVIGFWVALEDATIENGCLWCLPGQHRDRARSRFRRTASGTTMEVHDAAPYDTSEAIPLPAETGTLVVLHGTLPHQSGANTSGRSRHAYTLHVIDGEAAYPDDNWLQRPDLPLRGF